jgi:hypothetical protein
VLIRYAAVTPRLPCSDPRLLDTKLRRRSHAILNKGESRHALARAVLLHQLGELRNRVAETMAYRASGLNLVVNAIILWNAVYLSRAVDYARNRGIDIPAELLAQGAPLPWAHIALTGDYLWNEIDRPLERFRPVRVNRFNPNNFDFPTRVFLLKCPRSLLFYRERIGNRRHCAIRRRPGA